jgi:hypothetical protein
MAQMRCLKLANHGVFPCKFGLNSIVSSEKVDATINSIDRGHYFCVERSQNVEVFPLSNQGYEILSRRVDIEYNGN